MQVETPASKTTDPHTSELAEQTLTASGERARQQRIVQTLVELWPESTSAELGAIAKEHSRLVAERIYQRDPSEREAQRCRLDRWQIARRLPERATAGAVKRGESRQCRINGRQSITWMPTDG